MPASVPEMVRPEIATVFPTPTVLSANAPATELVDNVTLSPLTTPASVADPETSCAVAFAVPSYTRLLAVMPVTVSSLAVMDAVVVGWVSV